MERDLTKEHLHEEKPLQVTDKRNICTCSCWTDNGTPFPPVQKTSALATLCTCTEGSAAVQWTLMHTSHSPLSLCTHWHNWCLLPRFWNLNLFFLATFLNYTHTNLPYYYTVYIFMTKPLQNTQDTFT